MRKLVNASLPHGEERPGAPGRVSNHAQHGPYRIIVATLFAVLAGCTGYDPLPLPQKPDLAPSLGAIDTVLPTPGAALATRRIDIEKPLSVGDVGLLAILNDPDLKSERGEIGVARAGLLQAKLLPNPSASFNYGALITGPGTASAVGGSLAADMPRSSPAALGSKGRAPISAPSMPISSGASGRWRRRRDSWRSTSPRPTARSV